MIKFWAKSDAVVGTDIALKFSGFFNADLIVARITKVSGNTIGWYSGCYIFFKEFFKKLRCTNLRMNSISYGKNF